MTIVALALVACITILVVAFTGLLRSERRSSARERDLLLNQLLNLAGKPWQPAPADTPGPVEAAVILPARYTASPEQFPPEDGET